MHSAKQDLYFAAVGDVHGNIYTMLSLLKSWEFKHCQSLAFVLQVGDFEPHRHQADLATMDAPSKYKKLGDFSDFYTGKTKFPYPLWFIGGNHEPYGFLDLTPQGAQIAPNFHYLGRVGLVELAGLKVVGVSGIYKEELFQKTARPSVEEITSRSNSDYIGFIESEISQALDYTQADILLLHEWPTGIIAPQDLESFDQWRSNQRYKEVGNEYARLLVEALHPQILLCGHMHKSYRNSVSLPPSTIINICCLANVRQGEAAIAVFRLTPEGQIIAMP